MLVTEYGYHGNTQTGIDISDYKFSHKKGQGQKNYIIKTNIPDTYRGKYKNNDRDAARRCFWGAIDKQTLDLQCIQAADNKTEEKYLFVVDEARLDAVLKLGDKVVGNYAWQAPRDL